MKSSKGKSMKTRAQIISTILLPLSFLFVAVFALSAAPQTGSQTGSKTGTLKLPAYRKSKLPNGLTLLLMEKHELPLVSFQLTLKTGSTADPAGSEGMASVTAALLRRGTQTRTAEQYSADLDFIGGNFNAGVTSDVTNISAEFMKKDLAKGLDLLSDPVMHPNFPEAEITKMVSQRVNGVRSGRDSAGVVIRTYFNGYLLGSHPYARPAGGDEQSLACITRDSVMKFYSTYFKPGNAVLAVVGDFNSAEMEKMLAAQFGGWPSGAAPAVPLSDPTPIQGKRLLLVDKPDSTQTYFEIGNVGISRTNPDRVAVNVVNTLFGGSYTSMINSALRIKSGLTYGASAGFDERRVAGTFTISTYTKNATTEKAMDMALDVLTQLHEKGITAEQLASAKSLLKGQYPSRMETSDGLARMICELEVNGLDASDVNDFYAKVDAVTLADARRIIQKYYPLDNLVFVVVGKASEIGPILKKYAPQEDTRSISGPGFWSASASH
jgi:zinc protease